MQPGWPLLVHWCESCHYNTPVPYTATVWTQEHTCTHCGLGNVGADIAGHTPGQMNLTQHDELAELFAQNMQVSAAQQEQLPDHEHAPQQVVFDHVSQYSEKRDETPIHFVSTHYTGTAHIKPDPTSEPSQSPPPPYHEALVPDVTADILRNHSVDPSALLPNQLRLFQNADDEQRLRLLELWRISPPSYPLEYYLNGDSFSTSVGREEVLARLRVEQRAQSTWASSTEEHMPDRTTMDPISPIRESGEPAWPPAARMRAASIASSRPATRYGEVESYIVNGYAADQSAKAMDPVYAAAAHSWRAPLYAQATFIPNPSEHQFEMYDQIRNHADWERLNEHIARERLQGQMDDDMEL